MLEWIYSLLHLYFIALSGCGQAVDFLCCVYGSPLHNVTFLIKMLKTDHLASEVVFRTTLMPVNRITWD